MYGFRFYLDDLGVLAQIWRSVDLVFYYWMFISRLIVLLGVLNFTTTVQAVDKWNSGNIDWITIESAFKAAKARDKKIMLVLHSQGCGACDDYSVLFGDVSVVAASKELLMVLLDDGENEELSESYTLDGSYVPRTYFLNPDGSVVDVLVGKKGDRFKYYFAGRGAKELAELMLKAGAHED